MISPCSTTEHLKKSNRYKDCSNTINYAEFKKKQLLRQVYLRRQQQLAFRRFVFSCILLIVCLFVIFKVCYHNVYLPVKNSQYTIKVDKNFFHSSEAMLTPLSFMGYKYLTENPYHTGEELMKDIPEGRELLGLKARLLPVVNSDSNYRPGIYIWDSRSHNFVSINGDENFQTASIIKIPVLLELFRQIDRHLKNIDASSEFNMFHLAEGSGGLQYRALGGNYSIDYLAAIMIQHSDNTATNILLDEIGGMDSLNKVMKAWGIKKGYMENWLPDLTGTNLMTPKEFARMLYNIDNPDFLSQSSREKIYDYMLNIRHRNLIRSGIPAGATIAHKTGDIGTMVGDAGIVTLPNGRKIIIVAMIERPWNSYKAKEMIRQTSKITFDYFTSR